MKEFINTSAGEFFLGVIAVAILIFSVLIGITMLRTGTVNLGHECIEAGGTWTEDRTELDYRNQGEPQLERPDDRSVVWTCEIPGGE